MRCRALATTTPKTVACSRLVFRQYFPPLFPLLRPTLLLIYVTFRICFNWLGISSKGCCAPFARRSRVVAIAIVTTAIKGPPRRRPADESYSNYNFRSFSLFIQKMEIRHVHGSVISRFALCHWFRPQDVRRWMTNQVNFKTRGGGIGADGALAEKKLRNKQPTGKFLFCANALRPANYFVFLFFVNTTQ